VNRLAVFLSLALLAAPAAATSYLSVSNVQITEGQNYCVVVSRTGGSGQTAPFTYKTVSGTATSPADYLARSGSQSVRKGTNKITICNPTVDDALVEGTEQFAFQITSSNSSVIVSKPSGTITLLDNDVAPPPPPPPPSGVWVSAAWATAEYARTTKTCTNWPDQAPIAAGVVFARVMPGAMSYPLGHWSWGQTGYPENRYIIALRPLLADGTPDLTTIRYVYLDCLEGVVRS
jgi:hypothetical protein